MADITQVQLPDGSQYNIKDSESGYATESYVRAQVSGITKSTIGLGNVDNTSDAQKPVSTAQQTALNGKTNTSVIAYTETSTTATKRYEVGDQFILSGVLYTATAIIANGGTITVGTNCSASDTITDQLANTGGSASNITYDNTISGLTADDVQEGIDELASEKADKADLTSISETGSTASQAISEGTYFYLDGVLVKAKTAIASGATFTLNTNYEVVTDGGLNEFTKNSVGTAVNISSYRGGSTYTCPSDGYVCIVVHGNVRAFIALCNKNGERILETGGVGDSTDNNKYGFFVRKGQKVLARSVETWNSSNMNAFFYPLED